MELGRPGAGKSMEKGLTEPGDHDQTGFRTNRAELKGDPKIGYVHSMNHVIQFEKSLLSIDVSLISHN